jgi:hypothetical protein
VFFNCVRIDERKCEFNENERLNKDAPATSEIMEFKSGK